jgi:hypothetical protein
MSDPEKKQTGRYQQKQQDTSGQEEEKKAPAQMK